jgi:hypothetical protein
MKMVVYFDTLIRGLKELEKSSGLGVHIPEDLRQGIDLLSQQVADFLQSSQEEIDLKERNNSLEQMLILLWMTFFDNLIKKFVSDHSEFPIYRTIMADKEHSKCVMADDIREKIHAIHKMLIESWPHMVPPRIDDINIPAGYLCNTMLYASWDGGIPPKVGFVEPPSLKPDAQPKSIEEYLKSQYVYENDYIKDQKVLSFAKFAKFAKDPDSEWCNPSDYDPTFLSDVEKNYGSKTYLDVYREYGGLLSDYHRETW